MTTEERKRLTELIDVISPSMQEGIMTDLLADKWIQLAPKGNIRKDAIGNLEFSVMKDASYPTLALVAHADTICIQLTCSLGNGKFRFRSIGTSPHMLLGQSLIILNEDNEEIEAVIGFDATSQFGQPKGLVFEDLWVDIVDENKRQHVSVGDLAVLKPRHIIYNNDMISATALDDRLGLFITGEVLRKVMTEDIHINLICVATAQEEVGLRGSVSFDFSHKPDAVIVLDVDYATDIPTPHEDQMGRLYLNNGPGIQRKADNSPMLRKHIQKVAKDNNLDYQVSLGRFVYGGTDSASLQTTRNRTGYHIANISIPCRYMHSPIETASLKDVETAIDIIASFAKNPMI